MNSYVISDIHDCYNKLLSMLRLEDEKIFYV